MEEAARAVTTFSTLCVAELRRAAALPRFAASQGTLHLTSPPRISSRKLRSTLPGHGSSFTCILFFLQTILARSSLPLLLLRGSSLRKMDRGTCCLTSSARGKTATRRRDY